MDGLTPCTETRANCYKITQLEEKVIVEYILDMDRRGFPPKIKGVEDMANYILESRSAKKVRKLWAHRFVKHYTELKMCFSCAYDFQRSLCKAVQLGNREWATAIICGNGESETIPPFLVVQGQIHLSNWYTETDFPADWAIKPTSSG
ncbi:hypothetical protein SS1G_07941 [Sclerotinia sclerotiorum 1980 UF-70]|uniref:HTH CENPB-type domain-containing protein n=1 Tax=Sclerotinia sclerotiorum (strain ATCC 18683 / 1980 / Ss-1) TaxID=665079 RepID=A7ERI7_SCLS1|nr:hypothetical protein SS1G_07941 [Sclerotinia sclerotiorum 1980 UF-70]EDN92079.1 hypothetical protein SS1G_07941 [Sclerotinia sclerotiorum 1980 UF-70]